MLSEFEQQLVTLARAELPEVEFRCHMDGSPCFTYRGETWTTGWPLADEMGWQFFRLADGNLAQELVTAAKGRLLPAATICFDYSARLAAGNPPFADIKPFVGSTGWMRVSKLRLRSAGRNIERIIASAMIDNGGELDDKFVERLFLLPGRSRLDSNVTPVDLDVIESRRLNQWITQAMAANDHWLSVETEKLDRYADDLEVTAEENIKRMQREVKERRRAFRANAGLTVQQKIEEQRSIKRMEALIDEEKYKTYERRKTTRAEVEAILDRLQADLELVPTIEPIFTIRWELK